MRIGYKSDVGRVRENNEDSFFVDTERGIFIAADGMGGHRAGEVASKMAVEIISSSLKESLKDNGDIPLIIHKAIQVANREIYKKAAQDANLAGMGTTVVLTIYNENKIYIAHVGDSRAYLIQGNEIKQLTQDHSLVAELLNAKEINEEDARNHHLRHVLSKALGTEKSVKADIQNVQYQNGDYFLFCTDGITDMLRDEEIRRIFLNGQDLQKICEDLISSANEKGGKDNMTVVAISIKPTS